MSQVTHQTVLALIGSINTFADESKARLTEQRKDFISQAAKERDTATGGTKKRLRS